MKRTLTLVLALLWVLAAAPSVAYVKPAPVVYNTEGAGDAGPGGDGFQSEGRHRHPRHKTDDGPSQPLPEPGTMAMASIGLMALGATLRRRRGR